MEHAGEACEECEASLSEEHESQAAWAEWEAEMRGYGYTQEEIAEMMTWGDVRESSEEEREADAGAAWKHELKRIFVIKRMQSDNEGGAREGEGQGTGKGEAAEGEAAATAAGSPSERSCKRPKTEERAVGSGKAGAADGPVRLACEDCSELTREQFWERYMIPNRPVLLRGACRGWRARREWVTDEGLVNTKYLREHFGRSSITVHNTARKAIGADQCAKRDITISHFLDWWEGPVGSRVRERGAAAAADAPARDTDTAAHATVRAGGEGARAGSGADACKTAAALMQEEEILTKKN
jgi:hypothetical protein